MAGQLKLCFAFLLVFHCSLVSCRHDYHQYYSRYVKGESSTESSSSSATDTSTSELSHLSTPEVLFAENVISAKENSYSSSNNDAYERRSSTIEIQNSYGGYDGDQMRYVILLRWGLTIGGIIVVGLIVCCVAICCPCCCRGKERRGYIIGSNVPDQPTSILIQPQIQQPVAVQHYPPETQILQQPPPYDTQPIQQQYQYPSTEHLLQQNPMQPVGQYSTTEHLLHQNPVGQQQFQQPMMFQDHHNPATAPPPYPTKY